MVYKWVEAFNGMRAKPFDDHCDSDLGTLKCHLFDRIENSLRKFRTLSVLDNNSYERTNGHITHFCRKALQKETMPDEWTPESSVERLQKSSPIRKKRNEWRTSMDKWKRCTNQTEQSSSCAWPNNDYDVLCVMSCRWQRGYRVKYKSYPISGVFLYEKQNALFFCTCEWLSGWSESKYSWQRGTSRIWDIGI